MRGRIADTISMMTSRATGILRLLIVNQENGGIVADHIATAAISAAIAEIEDINATVEAFHSSTVAAKSQTTGGAQ